MEQEIVFKPYTEEDIHKLRTHEFEKISRNVAEVAELFRELNELVTVQQESIDLIEDNISSTKEKVKEAEQELVKAEKYQKKSRWLKVGVAGLVATSMGVPMGILFGTKIAFGVISGTTLTYIMVR